jgi:hypothetical protein
MKHHLRTVILAGALGLAGLIGGGCQLPPLLNQIQTSPARP